MGEIKRCVPRTFILIVSDVIIFFIGVILFYFLYKSVFTAGASLTERIVLFLGGALFGTFFISLLYRAFVMGVWGVLYNECEITFILTKKDGRTYQWSDLEKSNILLTPDFVFHFPDKKTMSINPIMTNYYDFKEMLRRQIKKNHLIGFNCPF